MGSLVRRIFGYDPEQDQLMKVLARIRRDLPKARILDIGCGYGRNLSRLVAGGFDATGVEVNEEIVRTNQSRGLPCVSVREFQDNKATYDVLILSHVIEHFVPGDLLPFLDGYLDRLNPDGKLVILTPCMSPYFYADFDHVKPYLPSGLLMVFGVGQSQVQYYSRNKLELEDVWFRKSFPRFTLVRSRYVRTPFTLLLRVFELASATGFWLLRGRLGRVDGWLGVFKKVASAPARP